MNKIKTCIGEHYFLLNVKKYTQIVFQDKRVKYYMNHKTIVCELKDYMVNYISIGGKTIAINNPIWDEVEILKNEQINLPHDKRLYPYEFISHIVNMFFEFDVKDADKVKIKSNLNDFSLNEIKKSHHIITGHDLFNEIPVETLIHKMISIQINMLYASECFEINENGLNEVANSLLILAKSLANNDNSTMMLYNIFANIQWKDFNKGENK